MRVWDCLGSIWFFENNYSSLLIQFSSLDTHHSSHKIPQFPIPHPFGTYFSVSHHSIFSTFCGTHTWALGQRLPASPSFPTIFFTSHFPFTPSALLLSQNANLNPCEYIVKLMYFLFFLLKSSKVAPSVTILSLMKVAPGVIFHRSLSLSLSLFGSMSNKAELRFWMKILKKPMSDEQCHWWATKPDQRATKPTSDEWRVTPLMWNMRLKEREKQSCGSEILEIVWIEKFVSWFWRLMGLKLRWWCQWWSQDRKSVV